MHVLLSRAHTPSHPADASGVDPAMKRNEHHDIAQTLLRYAAQLCLPGRWTCGIFHIIHIIAIDPVVVSDTWTQCRHVSPSHYGSML